MCFTELAANLCGGTVSICSTRKSKTFTDSIRLRSEFLQDARPQHVNHSASRRCDLDVRRNMCVKWHHLCSPTGRTLLRHIIKCFWVSPNSSAQFTQILIKIEKQNCCTSRKIIFIDFSRNFIDPSASDRRVENGRANCDVRPPERYAARGFCCEI